MKKLLTSLLLASTLTFGCGEYGQRLSRLIEISNGLTYTSTPAEKKYQMQETRQELDRAMKIAEKYTSP